MPTKMMKRVGIMLAIGLFVLIAGMNCMIVLTVKKQTTTFLYWRKNTIGTKLNGE